VVVLAIHALSDTVTVPVLAMLLQKRVTGSSQGSIKPHTDLPVLIDLVMDGKLALEPLIARRIGLDDLPKAMQDMQHYPGRTVVVFPPDGG
jgi:Zn-dependent alcohol dehydrogenase